MLLFGGLMEKLEPKQKLEDYLINLIDEYSLFYKLKKEIRSIYRGEIKIIRVFKVDGGYIFSLKSGNKILTGLFLDNDKYLLKAVLNNGLGKILSKKAISLENMYKFKILGLFYRLKIFRGYLLNPNNKNVSGKPNIEAETLEKLLWEANSRGVQENRPKLLIASKEGINYKTLIKLFENPNLEDYSKDYFVVHINNQGIKGVLVYNKEKFPKEDLEKLKNAKSILGLKDFEKGLLGLAIEFKPVYFGFY